VRYDGTGFAGWQVQPGERTVQGAIEEKLGLIASTPVRVISAGRTDSGVHALGQVIAFDWPANVPLERVRRSLSQMLGPEVRVERLEPAADGFHPIRDAVSKTYAYCISRAREPDPFLDRYAWTIGWDIERNRVAELMQHVVGEHDFGGFCSSGSSVETTVRTIHAADVVDGPVVGPQDARDTWHIRFTGNGFLYKMVRNLTGTVMDIARGHLPESALNERLHAPMPYSGYTAPAKGLFLIDVKY
jgi:tRNA pseudouridine38-40 synthase